MGELEVYNGLKVLSSYHRKGGVGKTFLASTIAYLLATGGPDGKGKKRRVLVLDYDSQQDSSKAFLKMMQYLVTMNMLHPYIQMWKKSTIQIGVEEIRVLTFFLTRQFMNIRLLLRI